MTKPATTSDHCRQPGWFTQHVCNRLVGWLTRRGLSAWGSRVLEVPGRTTGEPRRVPVAPNHPAFRLDAAG